MRTNRLIRILTWIFFLYTLHFTLYTSAAFCASKGNPPAAYWRFDEGGGTTAYDDTSNNNDLAFYHEVSWKAGKYGKALQFDGVDDVVTCNSSAGGVLNPASAMSVSAWVYVNGTKSNNYIVTKGWGDAWELTLDGNNKLNFRIVNVSGGAQQAVVSINALQNGQWYYVTGTYDQQNIKVYINGSLDNSQAYTLTIAQTGHKVAVGGIPHMETAYPNNGFNGKIDDVRIYNYARTSDQVMVDYNAGSATYLGGGADPNEGNPPVGHWKLDENTGATAYDRSGNGNNGTLTNGPTWIQGKNGPAVSFDGTNDYVDCGTAVTDTLESAGTIEMWVYPTALGGLFSRSTGGGWVDERIVLHFYNTGGKPNLTFSNGSNYWQHVANSVVPTDVWTHIGVSWDSSNVKFYINGQLDKSMAQGGIPEVTGIKSWIGRVEGLSSNYFNGKIDDVKIYNYARTQAQIAYDYNKGEPAVYYKFDEGGGIIAHNEYSTADTGATPLGWWRLDEGTGTSVADTSGNGLSGTASAATWASGKVGPYGLNNANVTIGDNALLEGMSNLTISAWVYPTSLAGNDREIVTKGAWNSSPPMSYRLMYQTDWGSGPGYPNGYWKFHIKTSAGEYSADGPNGVSSTRINMWHYLVGVYDGAAGKVRIYDNGVLLTETSAAGTINTNDYNTVIWAGASGIVDDVRIYNYARTPEQIYNDYKTTHGTLVADTKFMDGKIGKALTFDGTGDYVDIPDSTALRPANAVTLSCWIKHNSVAAAVYVAKQVGSSSSNSYALWYDSGALKGCAGDSSGIDQIQYSWTPSVGQWYHVEYTFDDSSDTEKLYINGQQVASDSNTKTMSYNESPVTISYDFNGPNRTSGGASINGLIDDVRIYNYARNAEQVLQDYNAGTALHFGSVTGMTDPWGGALPVAQWKLDENTGVLAKDASQNSNNGTLGGDGVGTDVPTWTQGKNGPGLSFDGTDYVQIPHSAIMKPTSAITVSAWAYRDNWNGVPDSRLFSCTEASGYELGCNSDGANYLCHLMRNGSYGTVAYSLNSLSSGWHHFLFTYDGRYLKAYVDGQQAGSANDAGGSYPIQYPTSNPHFIGQEAGVSGPANASYFTGRIDDVRVYDYAMTQAQISWLYSRGKPVAYYRFDEASGTTCYDDTGNNNGTATIGGTGSQTTIAAARANGATGKFGKCMSFDGTDDYVNVANTNNTVLPASNAAFTISLWFNSNSTSTATLKSIMTNETYNVSGFRYGTDSSARLYFWSSESGGTIGLTSSRVISQGIWYHAAIVYTGSSAKMYINGAQEVEDASGTIISNTNAIKIAQSIGGKEYFNGLIDDVRIYNYARTADQIQQDYNAGLSSNLSE